MIPLDTAWQAEGPTLRLRIPVTLVFILLSLTLGSVSFTRASMVTMNFATTVTTAGTSIFMNGTTYHNGDSAAVIVGAPYVATANPDVGYTFQSWGGFANSTCISVASPYSQTTHLTISCDGGTLLAAFALAYPILFKTNPTSGVSITWTLPSYPPLQSFNYTDGQSGTYPVQRYAANANPLSSGDTFSYWTESGGLIVTSNFWGSYDLCHNPAEVGVSGAGSLGAVFNTATPPNFSVTFNFNSTRGSLTFGGTPVGNQQTKTYARGCYPIKATLTGGYDFSGWTLTGGLTLSDPNQRALNDTVVLSGNATLTANFGLHTEYFITNPSGAGSITFNGKTYNDGQKDGFEPGTTFTASATPKNSSYVFKSWAGDSDTILNSASANPTTGYLSSQSNAGSLIAYFTLQTSCGSSCNIQINSTATISNVQYDSSTGKLSFNATGPTGGSAFVTVAIPVSSGIKINQLTIIVNNTPPPLPFTYTCDNPPSSSPCTAASFYSVTFNLHFSNDYVFFYLRGASADTPPLLAILIAILVAPVLLLCKRRRSWLRYNEQS